MNIKETGSHSFEIEDAIKFGSIEKALIYKEISRMALYKARNNKSPWVYYSASALADKFPYLNERSIDRWLKELLEAGHLVSQVNNKKRYDKTKSYTLRHFGEWISQNGESIPQSGEPIPPLSTPLSTPLGETEVSQEYVLVDSSLEEKEKRPRKPAEYLEVFKIFKEILGVYPLDWRTNKTIQKSADNLWKERKEEQIRKALETYLAVKDIEFCPEIYNPTDLDRKWKNLNTFSKKHL